MTVPVRFRRGASRAWRVAGSRPVLFAGVLLLAASAVWGNAAQSTDRNRSETTINNLRRAVTESKAETAELQDQLDKVKGEQECRTQIAAEAEVYSGQLAVGIADAVVANGTGDLEGLNNAIDRLQTTAPNLTDALERRLGSVDTCAQEDP